MHQGASSGALGLLWIAKYHLQQMKQAPYSTLMKANEKSMLFYFQKAANLGSEEAVVFLQPVNKSSKNPNDSFDIDSTKSVLSEFEPPTPQLTAAPGKKALGFCIKDQYEQNRETARPLPFFPPSPHSSHHKASEQAAEKSKATEQSGFF